MTNEEKIRANAEKVKEVFAEQGLDYDEASIQWIDGYIDRNREGWDDQTRDSLGNTLGSFVGECIIENFGGAWNMTEHGLSIEFADGNSVFPFNKVNKHIQNGPDDSIASFYSTIAALRGVNHI